MKSESEVSQSCPTLCDPMDCSPPGSSVPGLFQARVLEWGAIAFSVKTAAGAAANETSSRLQRKICMIACITKEGMFKILPFLLVSVG